MTTPHAEPAQRPPIAALELGRPFDGRITAAIALVVGALVAVVVGYLVVAGEVQLAVGAAVALPVAAFVIRDPFVGVMLWVLVMPYFVSLSAETGPVVWALHRIGIPALIVLTAVHARLGWRRWGLRIGFVDVMAGAFIVIGFVNVWLFAPNPIRMTASFYDKLVVPIAIFWLLRALAPRRREIMALVAAGSVTITIEATIGILSWVAPSILPSGWLGRAGERTTGTLGGPGPFTITLVLFALLAIHAASQSEAVRQRAVLLGTALLAAIAVFLSLSRGSWLGGGLALAGMAVVHRRLVGIGAVIGLVVLIGLSVGPLADQFAFAQERISDADTVESRIITNDAATRMIEARPVTGFGFGNFERFDESFKRRVGDIPLKLGGSAHNTYLNMLAELGIPATALYVGIPALLLVTTVRRWRELPTEGLLSRWFVVVLWLAALDQLVVQNFLEMIHASFWGTSIWWLTLGLIATMLDRALVEPSNATAPMPLRAR
jgi:O-antigen ligase